MPTRTKNQGQHPGKPDQKCMRRTPQQVKADKEAEKAKLVAAKFAADGRRELAIREIAQFEDHLH